VQHTAGNSFTPMRQTGEKATATVAKAKKVKPNDSCHCGSGKKYKKCHKTEDDKKL
jgi:uncharacterized protein YchJ